MEAGVGGYDRGFSYNKKKTLSLTHTTGSQMDPGRQGAGHQL